MPAIFIISSVASVCPCLSNTPPFLAINGNTWPGLTISSFDASFFDALNIVVSLSLAETPVVTFYAASIEIVKLV